MSALHLHGTCGHMTTRDSMLHLFLLTVEKSEDQNVSVFFKITTL